MSDISESKPRKLIPIQSADIMEVPPVENILSKAVAIVANEIEKLYRLSERSSKTDPLNDRQGRVLQGHVKTLIELSREMRERDKLEDLSKMSDDELFALAKQIISKRESQ